MALAPLRALLGLHMAYILIVLTLCLVSASLHAPFDLCTAFHTVLHTLIAPYFLPCHLTPATTSQHVPTTSPAVSFYPQQESIPTSTLTQTPALGLGRSQQPTGSFLFLGPTGVGKTELAKALASGRTLSWCC